MPRVFLALLVTLLVQAPLAAQFNEKWGVPGSPTGQKVGLLLEMVDRGDDDFTREMLEAHFAAEYMAVQTMAEHLSEFRRMHEDLPGLRPAGVARMEAGARFRAQSSESGRSVSFTFQVDDGKAGIGHCFLDICFVSLRVFVHP